MSGIYIHIPYCKQACHYCDFHFSTSLKTKGEMLEAMKLEIELRKDYLKGEVVKTIYFGGGTPSLVGSTFIKILLDKIVENFHIDQNPEITLEVNPEDCDITFIKEISEMGINRLSIGVQSFDNKILNYLNRIHSGQKAFEAIENSINNGIRNISIDLIYGIPNTDLNYWESQLEQMKALEIQHFSAYSLTIEPKTYFGHLQSKKKFKEVDESSVADQFASLIKKSANLGFDHYEISNFALPNYYSQHNMAYWKNENYLGIGPGAHSYNKRQRSFNISNNNYYIYNVTNHTPFYEIEFLTMEEKFVEYIMTSLRTKWGCNLKYVKDVFQVDLSVKPSLKNYVDNGLITVYDDHAILTDRGKFIADNIILNLI